MFFPDHSARFTFPHAHQPQKQIPANQMSQINPKHLKGVPSGEHLALAIPLSPTYPFMISLGSWNPVKTRDSERCGNWSQCPIKPIRFDG